MRGQHNDLRWLGGYSSDQSFIPVSPASPEKASKEDLFSTRCLTSSAFRMVGPLIAALDEAMRVKSLPVRPNKTSISLDLAIRQLLIVYLSGEK